MIFKLFTVITLTTIHASTSKSVSAWKVGDV